MLTLDLNVSAGRAFTAIGIIGGPTESFTTSTLSATTSNLGGVDNTYTLTFRPSSDIVAGATITLSGLTGSQTSNNASLTIAGAGASLFGSSANWTQSSGSLVLTVDTGQTVPNGSDTVITFVLANPASSAGVTSVNLSSASYATATISGLFLASAANKYNIPDSTDQQTEATILALTPTNPAGEVTVKFGSDTYDLYVWDGSSWYRYDNLNSTSVSFDGTDDYLTTNQSSLATSGDCTISLWFNSASLPGSGAYDYMFSLSDGRATGTDRALGIRGTGSDAQIVANTYASGWNLPFTNTSISAGTWYHVAVVFTSGNAQVYFNGVDKGSKSVSTFTISYNQTVIGGMLYSSANHFNGKIDEVSVFHSALSSSDIESIYNGGVPGDLSTLSPKGWWRNGEGIGDTASGGGAPANTSVVGTVANQGTVNTGSGQGNMTGTNGPTFSTTTPS